MTTSKARRRVRVPTMTLGELRKKVARVGQADMAEMLAVTQGYVSQLERRDDMMISSLIAYVEALGGDVEIQVRIGDRVVRVAQFG